MLDQNDPSERMLILLEAIIAEAKDNSKAFMQMIHALQTSTQRVNRWARGTPRTLNSIFFATRITFQNNGSLFLLECCLCVSLPSTTEDSSIQYRAVYGAHPTPASASGRDKLRTICN
jgi:hypothetical protein